MTKPLVDKVEAIFRIEGEGRIEALRAILSPDAPIHVPEALPFGELRGIDGIVEVVGALLRQTDGAFRMDLLGAIGEGDLVTIINRATATRKGAVIDYHNQWTLRFEGDTVAEAWLIPSVPGTEIIRLYGLDEAGADDMEGETVAH